MLITYLKFGMCNCSVNFMVMPRGLACAAVTFVEFPEHLAGIS